MVRRWLLNAYNKKSTPILNSENAKKCQHIMQFIQLGWKCMANVREVLDEKEVRKEPYRIHVWHIYLHLP